MNTAKGDHVSISLDDAFLTRRIEWADGFLRLLKYFLIYFVVMIVILIVASFIEFAIRDGILGAVRLFPSVVLMAFYHYGGVTALYCLAYICVAARWRVVMFCVGAAMVAGVFMYRSDAAANILIGAILAPAAPLIWPQTQPAFVYFFLLAVICWFFLWLQFNVFAGLAVHIFSSDAAIVLPQAFGRGRSLLKRVRPGQILEIPHAPFLVLRRQWRLILFFVASTILFSTGALMLWSMMASSFNRDHPCLPGDTPVNEQSLACLASGEGMVEFFAYNFGTYLVVSISLLYVANRIRDFAKRRLYERASDGAVTERGVLPQILFLRSFRDDHVALSGAGTSLISKLLNLGRRSQSLDSVIVEELGWWALVAGIGKPGVTVPDQLGALREQIADENWQAEIIASIGRSIAVVLVLDETQGVRWEFEQVLRLRAKSKTLFVFHPKMASAAKQRFTDELGVDEHSSSGLVGCYVPDEGRVLLFTSRRALQIPQAIYMTRRFILQLPTGAAV